MSKSMGRRPNIGYPQFRAQLTDIVYVVAEHYGISPSELLSRNRGQLVALARQVAYALCRDLTPASSPEIGAMFSRDHTTVLQMVEALAERMKRDKALAMSVAVCRVHAVKVLQSRRVFDDFS